MRKTLILVFTTAAAVLLNACKGKDGDPGPAGPSGQALTGSLIGFVELIDEFDRPQAKNGVTVALENVTPAVSTTTDANGRYELTNVRSGTYTIVLSKQGYGTTKIQGYPHAGGDQPAFLYTKVLEGISTTTVQGFSIGRPVGSGVGSNNTGEPAVSIVATLVNNSLPSQNLYAPSALLFLGTTSSVNAATGTLVEGVSIFSSSPTFLTRSIFARLNLASGSTAYAIMYGARRYSSSGYTDPQTGRYIYTTLNATPSQVVSFIVP